MPVVDVLGVNIDFDDKMSPSELKQAVQKAAFHVKRLQEAEQFKPRTKREIENAAFKEAGQKLRGPAGAGWMEESLVPLGAALVAPVQGVRQMFGNEAAGQQAVEAERQIEAQIPGGGAGITAGKLGVTALASAPSAAYGAGVAGIRGLVQRAAGAAAPIAAVEGVQPMQEDESRVAEAAKAGGLALVLTPAVEKLMQAAAPAVFRVADKVTASGTAGQRVVDQTLDQELSIQLRREGVDWAKLGGQEKEALRQFVKDSLQPDNLSQNAIVRAARAEQVLGIPLTRGQAERSTDILRQEQMFGGDALTAREAAQNEALTARLEGLATARGGRLDPMAQGGAFRGATQAKEDVASDAVNQAYRKADEIAGAEPVPLDAIGRVISENPGFPGIDSIVSRLKKAGVQFTPDGDIAPGQVIDARTLASIRKMTGKMRKSPERGEVGIAATNAIDESFDEAGIDAYRKATALARADFAQFKHRNIPATILKTRQGVQEITSTSKLPQFIMSKSPEELRDFKVFLARGNEAKLREFFKGAPESVQQGVQAVNDLKSASIGYLLNQSTRRNQAAEGAIDSITPESLITAYSQFGGGKGPAAVKLADEKFRALLGPKDFAELKNILKVAEDMAVPGRAKMKGSGDTNVALFRRLLELWSGVPPGATEVSGAVRGATTKKAAKKSAEWSAQRQAEQSIKEGYKGIHAKNAPAYGKIGALSGMTLSDLRETR